MKQGAGIREQGSGAVVGQEKVVVLPRVWAVGEKKPVRSVGLAGGVQRGGGASVRPVALPAEASAQDDKEWEARSGGAVEVAFYRKYTEAMLRRYAVMSLEAGRVPSMLGREMFRGKVTSYKMHGFDDVVNFCLDVESCLRRVSGEDQVLLKRVAVQQYTQGEAALMLGMSLRTCVTRYSEALDRMTRVFLNTRLLEPQNSCQEARRPLLRVSS